MKEKYPLLRSWKEQGLKSFPKIPESYLRDHIIDSLVDELKSNPPDPYLAYLLNTEELPPDDAKIAQEIADMIVKTVAEESENTLVEMIKRDVFNLGRIALDARQRIISGEDRETVLRDLGNRIFPNTKGGASIFDTDQKRLLRTIYNELQGCIKESRKALDSPVPIKTTDGYDWGKDIDALSKNLTEKRPDIASLFEPEEINQFFYQKKISEISLEIIRKRLKLVLRAPLKSRTLWDIITGSNVKPLS